MRDAACARVTACVHVTACMRVIAGVLVTACKRVPACMRVTTCVHVTMCLRVPAQAPDPFLLFLPSFVCDERESIHRETLPDQSRSIHPFLYLPVCPSVRLSVYPHSTWPKCLKKFPLIVRYPTTPTDPSVLSVSLDFSHFSVMDAVPA